MLFLLELVSLSAGRHPFAYVYSITSLSTPISSCLDMREMQHAAKGALKAQGITFHPS